MRTKKQQNKNKQKENPVLMGWVCPRCGKVHSPFVPSCDCVDKTKQDNVITPPQLPYDTIPLYYQVPYWVNSSTAIII